MRVKIIIFLLSGLILLPITGCDGAKDREAKYLNKAQVYFEEENYDKVRVELKNVLQINPKNVDARYLQALVAEQKQEWRKMFGALSAVVDAKPDHFDAQLQLGKLFLFSKDIEKATEKAELVLVSQPENPQALALKATIYLSQNKKSEAKVFLEEALKLEPGHYEASLLMMKMLDDEQKPIEVKQVLENALVSHPEKLKLSMVKINLLLQEGKKQQAETIFKDLIQRFPENEMLYYSLTKLYVEEKKIEQAELVLNDLVTQLPDKNQVKFVLIDFLSRQYGTERAEEKLNVLINESPDDFGFKFAKLSLYKDQPEKIQQILEQIIEEDKLGVAGIDARNKLAGLLNYKGETKPARKLVEEVIELDARNASALLLRAGFLIKDADFDAAIADARTILRDQPESEKALMLLAIAQIKTNHVELAQQALEKVLMINPKNVLAIKDVARLKVRNNDEAGAIELLEKAQALFKEDRDFSVMLIDLYGKRKEWKKAEEIATALLVNSEAKELPHYKLAQLYMAQKKFEAAIKEFSKVRLTKPAAADVLTGMVNSYLALKQVNKAEKLLDGVLAENKDNPSILTLRAELHRNQKQFIDAETVFKRVVELKPEIEVGYKNLATVYLSQKQLDKAIAVYEQGVQAVSENGNLLMQLGLLNTEMGDISKAIAAYEKLLPIAPDNLLLINNLASLLAESSDQQQLQKANKIVVALKDSTNPALLDTYGWVSFKNGKTDEALNALEAVMQKEGVVAEMHYHLGMVYLENGRVEEAKIELEKAVEGDANYISLETAKAELKKLNLKP